MSKTVTHIARHQNTVNGKLTGSPDTDYCPQRIVFLETVAPSYSRVKDQHQESIDRSILQVQKQVDTAANTAASVNQSR